MKMEYIGKLGESLALHIPPSTPGKRQKRRWIRYRVLPRLAGMLPVRVADFSQGHISSS